jgi:hypothetical protein
MQEKFELIRKVHMKFYKFKHLKLGSFCNPLSYVVFNLDCNEEAV